MAIIIIFIICVIKCRKKKLRNGQIYNVHRQPIRNNLNRQSIRNNSNRQQRENVPNEHQIIHFSNSNQENEKKRKELFKNKLYPIIYNKELFKENYNNSCSICLENYIDQKSLISLTPCNHIFHSDCLKKWSNKNTSYFRCPNCNYDFIKENKSTKNVRHNNINIDNNCINSNWNTSSLRTTNNES